MKRILISGANGLLGQKCVRKFALSHEVLATVRHQSLAGLVKNVRYATLDIAEARRCRDLLSDFKPDVIINAASFTSVDRCEIEKEQCWRANVKGVENLARYSRRHMVLLVHFSSDYIFDGHAGPYKEDDPPHPLGFYGKSKLASENAIRVAGIPYAILRTNVLYGTGHAVKHNFFLWAYHSLKSRREIRVVTDQFNNPTLVDDLADGIGLLIDQSKYGIYHLGGTDYLSRYKFACRIADVFGFPKSLIHPVTSDSLQQKAPRPMKGGLNIERARQELGYHPKPLLEALQFLKEQPIHGQ